MAGEKKKGGKPQMTKLEEQVRNEVGRIRWRLAVRPTIDMLEGESLPEAPPAPGKRLTGRLYRVFSSCLGEANLKE